MQDFRERVEELVARFDDMPDTEKKRDILGEFVGFVRESFSGRMGTIELPLGDLFMFAIYLKDFGCPADRVFDAHIRSIARVALEQVKAQLVLNDDERERLT